VNLVGEELLNRICYYRDSWLPARSLVEAALIKRKEVTSRQEECVKFVPLGLNFAVFWCLKAFMSCVMNCVGSIINNNLSEVMTDRISIILLLSKQQTSSKKKWQFFLA